VDLRSRGDAVPLVDDLASVELDLWASERGLTRVATNLFGL
jgi:formate dehydrogenase maturation protein FdhE